MLSCFMDSPINYCLIIHFIIETRTIVGKYMYFIIKTGTIVDEYMYFIIETGTIVDGYMYLNYGEFF